MPAAKRAFKYKFPSGLQKVWTGTWGEALERNVPQIEGLGYDGERRWLKLNLEKRVFRWQGE